jgi:hypothetical protein
MDRHVGTPMLHKVGAIAKAVVWRPVTWQMSGDEAR